MKKLINMTLMVVLLAAAANAKPNLDKVETAVKGYVVALNSDNAGLRHSALYNLAVIKAEYPEIDFSNLDRQLQKMSTKDEYPLIRLHADLTRTYLKDNSLQSKVQVEANGNPVDFFKNLYLEMESSYAETYAKEVVSR